MTGLDGLQSYQPTPFGVGAGGGSQGLEGEILRHVWAAKLDGITHADLRRQVVCRDRDFVEAIRRLINGGRLHSVRVLQWAGDSWPPMRLFLPEYSPMLMARHDGQR
ncbi:MAG: hypothetical protein HQM04_06630 [Magnetococcales bacterium]|nr:hypothetical protein [Magnetococcales bacterium]MBF0114702.1 hypothetical protein [Magnetococcales bacterium]